MPGRPASSSARLGIWEGVSEGRRWRREIWWFVLPLAGCPAVAALRPGDVGTATARTRRLLGLERALGVDVEPSIHAWTSAWPLLEHGVEFYYLLAHLSALIAAALWLAVHRPSAYVRFRSTFAVAQTMTIGIYLLWPVAPLRMVIGDGSGGAGPRWTRWMQYELAAVPSGHVVFALLVGTTVWRWAPGCWRWAGWLHLVVTVAIVVATAHHLLFDAAAAVAVTAAATVIARGLPASLGGARRPARHRERWQPAGAGDPVGAGGSRSSGLAHRPGLARR